MQTLHFFDNYSFILGFFVIFANEFTDVAFREEKSSLLELIQIYNVILFFMNYTLLITVFLTAVVLVVAAYVIAKLIGPRSYNPVKGEPYESGIPTRGSSWLPVSVGFYLFAILFLMFDIETVFLYPWAVVVKQFGPMALVSIGFFLLVLVFGLAYAWRKGALEWK